MIETAGLIRANKAFEVEAFRFALEVGVQPFRAPVGAAAARIIFGPLIDAHEDVPLEGGHDVTLIRSGAQGRLEAVHQIFDFRCIEQRRRSLDAVED